MEKPLKVDESKAVYRVYADVNILGNIEADSEDEVEVFLNAFRNSSYIFATGNEAKDRRVLVFHIESISRAEIDAIG